MVCHEGCDLSGKIQKDFCGGQSKPSIKQSTNAFLVLEKLSVDGNRGIKIILHSQFSVAFQVPASKTILKHLQPRIDGNFMF